LQAIAAIVASAATPLGWPEVAHAMDGVHAALPGADPKLTFFNAADAADVEAVAAQIIPSDDSPGAREAGVVHFIDRALGSFYAQLAGDYRAQLAAFQSAFRATHPGAVSFASLTSAQQVEYLKQVDETPFFNTTRLFTLLGMFSLPAYGGNHDGVGWKLIGFEDAHVFQPPFGYYDRDYPGFVIDPVKPK
jgi:gluconate 2-dehydrogenase gamma chain